VFRACLLLVIAAPLAHAQSASDVVGAWQRDWRAAAAGVEAVEMRETVVREIEGPRGTVRVETAARLRYAPGARAERVVERATVNGQDVDPERLPDLDARHERALGRGPSPLLRAPPSPDALLAMARLRGLRRETADGVPVWRVEIELPARRRRRGDRRPPHDAPPEPPVGAAWFAGEADAPRLVRLDLPAGPHGTLHVEYRRVDGLDVPAAADGRARLRQQRRLRGYEVTATVRATYADHRIARR
jgi:hypothetical protein